MSHRKWRETKQQPSRARSGHQISCCLNFLHFLCDILAPITVYMNIVVHICLLVDCWDLVGREGALAWTWASAAFFLLHSSR